MAHLSLSDVRQQFRQDLPKRRVERPAADMIAGRIHGCTALAMPKASDDRGDLVELLTTRDAVIEPIVHVYQVFAEPGSIRAWVFHEQQADRLCLTQGHLQVVLYDLREDSPTAGALVVLSVGADNPTFLRIPAFVAHGIKNVGAERAAFVNLPTPGYFYDAPDKFRLPFDTPLIPHTW
jgi:dTDP-4-dehydrorhamnose 3,5-epimerase